MSRHSTLERFIRGAVAHQSALAAAAQLPSLNTSAGISVEGEKIEHPAAGTPESQSRPAVVEKVAAKQGAS